MSEEEINPHDLGEPVIKPYAYLTEAELAGIYNGYMAQYEACYWWEWRRKLEFLAAAGAVYNMVLWIRGGKQRDVI